MSAKRYKWYKVAESKEELFAGGNGLVEITVGEKKICMALHQENLYACAAKCPHAGGRMAQGWLDAGGNIVCPLHRYRFDLKNGRNVSGEGYYLKTYVVELREEGVFVGVETGIF
jgi:3-phenylpropionate/trans-cinnamate dioxygenase ferredoxin subunit